MNVSTDLLCGRLKSLLPPPADVHFGTVDSETLRDGLAEARSSSGDDNYLALDGEQVFDLEGDVLFSHGQYCTRRLDRL